MKGNMKVTAAIFRDGDKVLLMRRAADQPLAAFHLYLKITLSTVKKH